MNEKTTSTDSPQVIATTPATTNTATQQPNGDLIKFYDGHRDAFNWGGVILLVIGVYLAYRWMYGTPTTTFNKR